MSEKTNVLEKQRALFQTRFDNAVTIASKPLQDLIEAFNAYVQTSNDLLAEKNREITGLKSQLIAVVNKDVPAGKPEESVKK